MKSEILKFIATGGEGQRLKPLTIHRPKPMIPVTPDKKIIDYSVLAGNFDTIVSTFYLSKQIEEYIKKKNLEIGIVCDSGLVHIGGSIIEHLDIIYKFNPSSICILSGDHYINNATVNALIYRLTQHPKTDLVVLGTRNLESHDVFNVNENGRLIYSNSQTETTKIASLGVYIVKFSWLVQKIKQVQKTEKQHYDLRTDLLFAKAETNLPLVDFIEIESIEEGVWQDLGTLKRLHSHICSVNKTDEKGNVVFPDTYIAADAIVSNSIVFSGAHISAGVTINKAIVDEKTYLNSKEGLDKPCYTKIDEEVTVFSRTKSDEE